MEIEAMTDLELAREWLTKGYTLQHRADDALAALLARVRLDEAKWWDQNSGADNQFQGAAQVSRLAALEQAAGGSAAGSTK